MASDLDLLRELVPVAEANLNRHLGIAQEWMPHDYVPWDRGRDFDAEPYAPGSSALSDVAQVAFEVNLLTEDNLPSYHAGIAEKTGFEGVWAAWLNRWTAEEARHSVAIRDYLLVTRGTDPVELERGRMAQMSLGWVRGDPSPLGGLAYVAFQELATRISHRNTGRYTDEPVAERLLARIAADENLHMIFYRDTVAAALDLDASRMVTRIATEVEAFQMPGTGIRDFSAKAMRIANAGIYDPRIHRDEVVVPLLRHWRFFEREGLSAEAEQARERTAAFLDKLDRLASVYERLRGGAPAASPRETAKAG